MRERIQKILASRGITSRRQAEELIKSGRVTCNGRKCSLGESADPDTDEIRLDGSLLPSTEEHVYIMLNKPRGYVTTLSDEKGRRTVVQLVQDCGVRVYPIGRLDMDSEGLLLFTNDGEFANRLMHPRHEVEKKYLVEVREFSDRGLIQLSRSIELDGHRIRQPKVRLIERLENTAKLELVIHEGRNRQIRRMCAAANMKVTRLRRVAEGQVELGSLPVGKWRHLTHSEIALLRE